MACPFCATGQAGLDRNLSTGEIIDQVRSAARTMAAEGSRLSNIVFMGMGEPLANFAVADVVILVTAFDRAGSDLVLVVNLKVAHVKTLPLFHYIFTCL